MNRTTLLAAGTAVLSPANGKVHLNVPRNWYGSGRPSPATLQPNPSPAIGTNICTQVSVSVPINIVSFIRLEPNWEVTLEQYSLIGIREVSSI